MKYDHTEDKNIKRHPATGVYYFKRGEIELSLKTNDWKEAKLRADLKRDQIDAAGVVAYKHRVKDLVAKYLDERAIDDDIRESTYLEMEAMFENHLLPAFGNKKLSAITPVSWKAYCSLVKRDYANHRKVLKGFLNWCVDKGFLAGIPDVSRIPRHERRKRRIVTPAELRAIFTHAKGSMRLFAALALYNGLRRKEIMTLRWAGIDIDRRILTIESDNNKLGRTRTLPFNIIIQALLADRITEQRGQSRWVFPNKARPSTHADMSGLKTAWHTVLKRAGLSDITWHDLRATYETWAHKSLEHTDTQKEKFADSSTEVQKRIYVHMSHEDLKGLEDVVRVPGLESIILDTGLTRGGDK